MENPIITVVMLTYNHEKFLEQSLDSVLSQETDFTYEIIVHDDHSTDSTSQIIRGYTEEYPDRIIPILQEENQWVKGIMIAPTFIFPKARGKYIATLEGDDYWTDPLKLQKQVGFLEEHPEYSGSAHQALVRSEESERIFKKVLRPDIHFDRLLGDRVFHTASFVFRTEVIRKYPLPPKYMHSYDRLLFMLVGANGPIRYFEEPMCAYRQHDGNITAHTTYDLVKKDLKIIPYLVENIPDFPKWKYLSFLHRICVLYPTEKPPLLTFLRHYLLFFLYSFSEFPKNIKSLEWTTKKIISQIREANKLRVD